MSLLRVCEQGLQKIWMNTFATLLALLLYPTDDANRPLKGADEILTMARETLRNIAGQVFWQLGILLGLILLGTFFEMLIIILSILK